MEKNLLVLCLVPQNSDYTYGMLKRMKLCVYQVLDGESLHYHPDQQAFDQLNYLLQNYAIDFGSVNFFRCRVLRHDDSMYNVCMLRAIDGFARSIDCAAPSMDPLIAHLSIDRATIDRSRNHRSIAHYCACAVDGRICARALV